MARVLQALPGQARSGKGGVGVTFPLLEHDVGDCLQCSGRAFEHHFVLQPEHSQPLALKLPVSKGIVFALALPCVGGTVQLDDETRFVALEVGDVATDRVLATELGSQQPPIP